jgi:hypothetical protein
MQTNAIKEITGGLICLIPCYLFPSGDEVNTWPALLSGRVDSWVAGSNPGGYLCHL